MVARQRLQGLLLVLLILGVLVAGFYLREGANESVDMPVQVNPQLRLQLRYIESIQYDKRVSSRIEAGSFLMRPKKYLVFNINRVLEAQLKDVVLDIYIHQDRSADTPDPFLALHQLVLDKQLLNKLAGIVNSASIDGLTINIHQSDTPDLVIQAKTANLDLRSQQTAMQMVTIEQPDYRLVAKKIVLDNNKRQFNIPGRYMISSKDGTIKGRNQLLNLSLIAVKNNR
ncbi:MAG: hypothetical protein GXP22_05125 [Gammaproteobacteria bacterium]|nr:hypothetical protein [Gammaproteobacteria bacterium]